MTSPPSLIGPEPQLKPDSALGIVWPLLLTVLVSAVLVFGLLVPHVRERFITLKKDGIEDLTRTAVGILDHYAALSSDGRMPLVEAQTAAIDHLRQIRLGPGAKGYFWINDRVPRILMHPYRPDLEGREVGDFTDAQGKRVFMACIEAVRGPEAAGFVDYTWQWQDDPHHPAPKISHVRLFAPWGWIVGTGLYVEDVYREIGDLTTRLVYGGLAVTAGVGLLLAYLTWQGIRTDRSRREAWKALRKRQEEHRAVLESSPHPVAVYDRQGAVLYVNPAFSRTFGWSLEDVLGRRIDFVPPDEREKTLEGIHRAYAEGYSSLETRRLTKDGQVRDVQISAAVFRDDSGAAIGMVVNLMDITARKQTEEALRASQETFQAIGNSARDAIMMIDDAGRITYWNLAGQTILGYSEAEAMGRDVHALIAPERYRDAYAKRLSDFGHSGSGPVVGRTIELSALHKRGHEVPIELSLAAVRFKDRWHAVGIMRDISERRKAESTLRESEEKYRHLVEHASDAIFITQDGVIKFPNRRMIEVSGYDARGLSTLPFLDFIHPDDRPLIAERHRKRLAGETVVNPVAFRGRKKGGESVWLELNAVTVEWEGRPAVLNFLRDVTERKKLEAEIQQAQRLESLGTLAGGVAHDFNNLLMGILGNATLMRLDIHPSHPHHQRLADIEAHVRSGAELTRQLLGFARGGKYEPKPADLNQVVQNTAALFGRTHKEIAIHAAYQPDLWTVEIDRPQIGQVLLNLLVNAWQSMPGGGDLTFATTNVILGQDEAQPHGLEAGRYARMTVSDTGIGMDEGTQRRIFEPFFTTRRMGRGTGLGLASAYGIVRNHGGMITVASQKGAGTTFSIYLPASDKTPVSDSPVSDERPRGRETILIVDDEPMIRVVGGELLTRLGYRVIRAENGSEALDIFQREHERIDLVILDMVMPGMSGHEVFDRLKVIAPEVRVLLSSGYSEDGEAKEILARGCDGFIQKPFDLTELSGQIRKILDGRQPVAG